MSGRVRFRGAKRLDRFSHGADVRRRGATAAAEKAHAERRRFARKEREIFRRGFRIDDAVALAFGEAGVGHAADTEIVHSGKFLQNRQKRLWAKRAIRADHLNILVFQLRCGIRGADIAVGRAFFRVGKLRHDGQSGKRANRVDGEEQFFDIRKRFEDVEVHAALFESESLLVKNVQNLFRSRMARLHADAQRADGTGNEDFASGRFARFAGDFHAAAVEALDFFPKAERLELETIRAEGVGFDDLRARFDVSLVDAEYRFRLGRIHFIETALRAHGIVEHRAHRAIGDKNRVFQPLVEIKNLHSSCFLSAENFAREMRSAFLFHEAGDGAHQIVLGEDFEVSVAHLDKNRGILATEDVSDALDGRGPGHLRQRFAHHFANDELTKILALQREVEYLVFVDRADRNIFLKYRNLRNVLLLHGLQGVENSLVRPRDDQFAHLAGGVFGVDDFRSGDGGGRVNVAALVHPQVIINLAKVACAGVRQQGDHEIIRSQILGEAQRPGNAAAAGAAGEEAFQLRQAARNDETFFVVHLQDIVQDFQIHGRREEILADAFHNVGLGFDGLPGLDEIVVERAEGIHPDNFDAGIFFLQVFSHAANGATGAYAANEMRDLAFAVFPNLGTRGAVVSFGIAGIVVLIRVVRIGNLTGEFFRHRIVAARIFRLDGGGTDDDFGAERFQEIDFFLGLLVGGREDALVSANRRDERQAHAGIALSAFNDRAAGLQKAFFLGFVNHADRGAIFYGAAGIGEFRFDVDLRLQALIDAVQAHQRGVTNRFQDVIALHQSSRFLRRIAISLASSQGVPLLGGANDFLTSKQEESRLFFL